MQVLSTLEQTMLWGVIAVAIISLLYAYWLWRDTIRRDKGEPSMQRVCKQSRKEPTHICAASCGRCYPSSRCWP